MWYDDNITIVVNFQVRQSLKELKIFLNGMGTVASNAVKELNTLKFER